jgi:hypothetical protein
MVSKRWTWLTGTAWLFAALTNAHGHVHYCFDGQEPPAAVHLVDRTDHDHEIPGHDPDGDHDDHEDLDVDLPNQALAKACKHDLPALAPAVAWTVGLGTSTTDTLVASPGAPPAPDPHHYRPPLRGPPH